jgi:hypothetical protein
MFNLTRRQFLMDAEGGGGGALTPALSLNGEGGRGEGEAGDFETWMKGQDKGVQELYSSHTSGLKSALSKERDGRSEAEKQLRELAKKAESGSEMQAKLTEQADQMAELTRKSAFYDKAHAAGVKNLNLAYLAARDAQLISDKGEEQFPELFGGSQPPPPGNAGSGITNPPGGKQTMDDMIRRRAGVS